jgi:hypothetical protein
MVQLHSIKIEKPNFLSQKVCHACHRPWLSDPGAFFDDSILYVSYFLTDNVVIQLRLSALSSGRAHQAKGDFGRTLINHPPPIEDQNAIGPQSNG